MEAYKLLTRNVAGRNGVVTYPAGRVNAVELRKVKNTWPGRRRELWATYLPRPAYVTDGREILRGGGCHGKGNATKAHRTSGG
jgi:hypothetical protein